MFGCIKFEGKKINEKLTTLCCLGARMANNPCFNKSCEIKVRKHNRTHLLGGNNHFLFDGFEKACTYLKIGVLQRKGRFIE